MQKRANLGGVSGFEECDYSSPESRVSMLALSFLAFLAALPLAIKPGGGPADLFGRTFLFHLGGRLLILRGATTTGLAARLTGGVVVFLFPPRPLLRESKSSSMRSAASASRSMNFSLTCIERRYFPTPSMGPRGGSG